VRPAVAFAPADDPAAALAALSRSLGLPEPARFAGHDPHGRPRAMFRGEPLAVSLSRCRGRAAVALARAGRVGVDLVDPGAPIAAEAMMELAAPPERLWLAALPEGPRRHRLFQLWAGREALLKGLGLGLAEDADQVELAPAGGGLRVLRAPGSAGGWHLDLQETNGLILALAWAD